MKPESEEENFDEDENENDDEGQGDFYDHEATLEKMEKGIYVH